MQESRLIFIISQPRSGSTLLQKLVSNHEKVETASEPWLMLPILSIFHPQHVNALYNYESANRAFTHYLKKKKLETKAREALKEFTLRLYTVDQEGNYFVDKTPRYYEFLEELHSLLPEAKFLVLKRNPFAALRSMLATWSEDEINTDQMRRFCRDFLIAPFRILNFCEKHGTEKNVYQLRYEDLVNSPETQIKDLCEWLGLSYDPKLLLVGDNEKVKGLFGDDAYRKQPLRAIETSNTDNWKKNMTAGVQDFFFDYQNFLGGKFLSKFGYEVEPFKRSLRNRVGSPFRKFLGQMRSEGMLK